MCEASGVVRYFYLSTLLLTHVSMCKPQCNEVEVLQCSFPDLHNDLLAACAKTLFALRTLRQHGLPSGLIHDIFQATVVAKLSYASPAWWGYVSAADRARLEAFLQRSVRLGFQSASAPTLASVCAHADDRLFAKIINNSRHLLRPILPPARVEHYHLRSVLITSNFPSDPLRSVTAVSS